VRYQSSSYYHVLVILYPPVTNVPIPLTYFINTNPQRTIAVEGSLQVSYNYQLKYKILPGVSGGSPMDTTRDNIIQASIGIGTKTQKTKANSGFALSRIDGINFSA
jgi:hypothetical protein